MLLYLMRHAWAGEFGDPRYPRDRDRPLTSAGQKRFHQWLIWLERYAPRPTRIYTSPYVRCAQTSELWQQFLELQAHQSQIIPLEELGCGAQTNEVCNLLHHETGNHSIAIVGHMPDIAAIAHRLQTQAGEFQHFTKAAVAAIQFPERVAHSSGQLQWFASPKAEGL